MDDDYELLDVGDAARLERFGALITDRPAPGALAPRRTPDRWDGADLRFDRQTGWSGPALPAAERGWAIELADLSMELRPTASGQVGVYPEHATHLPWLLERVTERTAEGQPPPEVLHLFAATGLATLALARAGAPVTHVDAARPTVAWARRNAERNGLAERPVRWIVEDAAIFAERERRRGRRYAGVVLDPPTYGHGARGASTTWSIIRDLPAVLHIVADLLVHDGFVLLTAHTEGVTQADLEDVLDDALRGRSGARNPGLLGSVEVELEAASGAILPLGAGVTWDGRG